MAGRKVYVTNHHTEMLDFADAAGGYKQVEPGATEYFTLAEPDSAQNQGMVHAGLISISETKAEAEKVQSKSAENQAAAGSA